MTPINTALHLSVVWEPMTWACWLMRVLSQAYVTGAHLDLALLVARLDAGAHEAHRLAEGLGEQGNMVPDLVRLQLQLAKVDSPAAVVNADLQPIASPGHNQADEGAQARTETAIAVQLSACLPATKPSDSKKAFFDIAMPMLACTAMQKLEHMHQVPANFRRYPSARSLIFAVKFSVPVDLRRDSCEGGANLSQ